MPIHAATYATPTNPLLKKKPSTVTMRTTETSHPFDWASDRQTPAICRPARGRISGLPGRVCVTGIVAPQLEQKRALPGNPVPQR
jgi:hypothetical protein